MTSSERIPACQGSATLVGGARIMETRNLTHAASSRHQFNGIYRKALKEWTDFERSWRPLGLTLSTRVEKEVHVLGRRGGN
mmetsp:Transcript_36114/g.71072  ORF Transcript_36114/g.71072 Transcript_36114/m.71072 type:complete len:81 (+) Transcript_36114:82-324(+)